MIGDPSGTPHSAPARLPRADESAAARIQPLATLPVFFKAAGRPVLVVGGTEAAAWKVELLLAAGAHVRCVTDAPCEAFEALAGEGRSLEILRRAWTDDDFADVLLALCDAGDDDEARRFAEAGRGRGVPINIVDRPAFCDFQFGSIVNRSPLVVAISTDGAAPVFGQAIRARIEALLPSGFARWAGEAKLWRDRLRARTLTFRERRSFWEAFTDRAFAGPQTPPGDDLFDDLARTLNRAPSRQGKVILVGAGPGDPELLTLRAVRALQTADVVLYDDLVSPGVLDLSRREAERVNVGKRGYKPSCGQDEISAMLVEFGKAGKVVARLKGGDPLIFGRANEEIAALDAAGIKVEIVPGVTAAAGAAASLVTSLTERDIARRVQFVTAHARNGQLPDDLDWTALADRKATTAVYMGVRTLSGMVTKLRDAGLPDETPFIMVERATWPDQRVIQATLESIEAEVAGAEVRGPSLFLFGAALATAKPSLA